MNSLQTKERTLGANTSLSGDIAKHMIDRLQLGQVVVVSKQPAALLASTRRQWIHLLRQLENRRASVIGAAKIASQTKVIARVQAARFSTAPPVEDMWADVIFATAENLLEFIPGCTTMYVATPTDREVLHKITSFMPKSGLVITYKIGQKE